MEQGSYEACAAVHPAWDILLRHRALSDPGVVCRLLWVSRGVRSTAMALCAGRLDVCAEPPLDTKDPFLQSFLRFLPQQAQLVSSLSWLNDGLNDGQDVPVVQHMLARALCEAGPRLRLTSLAVQMHPPAPLQQAAALASCQSGLTSLYLSHAGDAMSPSETQSVIQALSQLTALQSLDILTFGLQNINLLAPAVSGLTRLTSLSAGFNRFADLGRCLPPSLRDLAIGACRLKSDPRPASAEEYLRADLSVPPVEQGTLRPFSLNLAHLTALTHLCLLSPNEMDDVHEWERIYVGDQLPPGVQMLAACSLGGAALAVLQPLTQLTRLQLHHMSTEAADLQLLTVLTNLKVVNLKEFRWPAADRDNDSDSDPDEDLQLDFPDPYCAALPMLPIPELSLHFELYPEVLQQLGRCSSLTSLQLQAAAYGTAQLQDLGAALQQLRQLRRLKVGGDAGALDDPGLLASEQHDLSWMSALSSLVNVTSLELNNLPSTPAAMRFPQHLHHLRHLELVACWLEDASVEILARHLTGLHELDLSHNSRLTDDAMPAMAQRMKQLRRLRVAHTQVTQASVACLREMPALRGVKFYNGVLWTKSTGFGIGCAG